MASSDGDALRDDQWERLRDLVPGGRAGQRGPRCDNRLFVDALLWMARSGARWRDLPERYGDHQAVKRRYCRWVERDALGGFLTALAADADLEWLMINSAIVPAANASRFGAPTSTRQERAGPRGA